ncbi:MAG: ComF family protein [Candidatus Omnitrophica bacterium]|nr:ComF family protein [Candidatus Omnitrophota bacterium]
MKLYWEAFLRLIYPATCGVCNALLTLTETGLCQPCQDRVFHLRFAPDDALLSNRFQSLDEGWTLYPYQPPVQDILTGIKFAGKRWLIRVFHEDIAMLTQALASENHYDAIIPVPMARRRFLEREFNQSELIAQRIGQKTNVPVETDLLFKKHHTPSQGLLSQKERRINLQHAFEVRKKDAVKDRSFLLVDDIFTTGATAEEAARTLKTAGAKRVHLFALARTERDSRN